MIGAFIPGGKSKCIPFPSLPHLTYREEKIVLMATHDPILAVMGDKRIVINNTINFLKKRRLQISELNDQLQMPVEHEEIDDRHLERNSVKKALVKLPDGYRVVFNLYAVEGYDHKEIGKIIGVTEATSKSQYSRAKKKIKEIIKSDFVESI